MHAERGGFQECRVCGACKESVECIFLSVHRTIPGDGKLGTK